MLVGKKIKLRSLKESDLNFLMNIENNCYNWIYGSENKKYSIRELKNYLSNSKIGLTIAKQFRYVIEKEKPIGFIDLYNYSYHQAYVAVIINIGERNNGYAYDALNVLIKYCFNNLQLSSLKCVIDKKNVASINLFNKNRFKMYYSRNKLNYYILRNNNV